MKTVITEQGKKEIHFPAMFKGFSTQEPLQNSNGKNYKLANISFKQRNGEVVQGIAMIYEGNYKYGLTPGQQYLCVARQGEKINPTTGEVKQQIFLQLSHLLQGDELTVDMFGFDEEASIEDLTRSTTTSINVTRPIGS